MTGMMKGLTPRSSQESTTALTIVSILAIPRLPTPTAMRLPVGTAATHGAAAMPSRTER